MGGIEFLTIRDPRRDFFSWGIYLLQHERDHIHARGLFVAWGRGVQMMGLVQQALQEEATKRGTPVVHEFTAVNSASLELIRLFTEYDPRGKNIWGYERFEHRYEP